MHDNTTIEHNEHNSNNADTTAVDNSNNNKYYSELDHGCLLACDAAMSAAALHKACVCRRWRSASEGTYRNMWAHKNRRSFEAIATRGNKKKKRHGVAKRS